MILITGATGNLGSSVVNQLLKKSTQDTFVVTSSNQEGVNKLTSKGFQARLANFSDRESLKESFDGIEKLLLISTMDSNRFEQHKNVIDAAQGPRSKTYCLYWSSNKGHSNFRSKRLNDKSFSNRRLY